MIQRALSPLGIGVLAVILAVVWALLAGERVMPSYLAAWLMWAGLPFGALTVLLIMEIGGGATALALVPLFRTLALGVPLAALLFIPVLLRMHALYRWTGSVGPEAPFGRAWLHPGFFVGRTIIYFLIFSGLAALFAQDRPLGGRRVGALVGLFIMALVGTLAATDWIMSLDPGVHSGEFGLLIIAMQCAVATAGVILLGSTVGVLPVRASVRLLAIVSAIWLYLHFAQYLTMWSGDLPKEVAWYLMRDAAGGRIAEWVAVIGGFVLPAALLVLPLRAQARALPAVAMAVLLAHMLEALWFVTPVTRHHFALSGPDVLMLFGLGGIAIGLARLRRPARAIAMAPANQTGMA
jgi:hypothetical protein